MFVVTRWCRIACGIDDFDVHEKLACASRQLLRGFDGVHKVHDQQAAPALTRIDFGAVRCTPYRGSPAGEKYSHARTSAYRALGFTV